MEVADGVPAAIGRTPMVHLRRLLAATSGAEGRTHDRPRVLAKLESVNPGGSAKDRPASLMLADALSRGLVAPGGTLVESSSGNLGVALAQQARFHGIDFVCVVDPRTNRHTRQLIEAYGGTLHHVERPDPATGDWLVARQAAVHDLVARTPGAHTCDQYANELNARAHAEGTMADLAQDALRRRCRRG